MEELDVLLVSLGSTFGLRTADEQLRRALERAGAQVQVARAEPPASQRTLMLTDLAWARAARRAGHRALARTRPRAIIYSSTTAALLWPAPGAIRFDAPAAGNRRGRHGLWQRPLERRRLGQAPLLLPWSEQGLAEAEVGAHLARAGAHDGDGGPPGEPRALVLPVAVERSGPLAGERDIAAISYGANPAKKGLDRVLAAWQRLRASSPRAPGELLIAGLEPSELERFAGRGASLEGVRALGSLPRESYRALLRRARVFVCAPRREDYGLAQLEALADGCMLVSTAAPGPYVALALARELDQRLIGEDLCAGLRAALEQPREDYAARALTALEPFGVEALDRLVSGALLGRLLGQRAQLAQ